MTQIGNVLGAFERKLISCRALRLYFAALAAVASREAAGRSKAGRGKASPVRYDCAELAALCKIPVGSVRKELRSLERAGLLLFSESMIEFTAVALPGSRDVIELLAGRRSTSRLVPVPRAALRFMARSSKVALIKTMLGYCVRGLTLERDGSVRGKGTAKASWIAEACGLSLRAVRSARAELIGIGFISADVGSRQWKLNRDGAYFAINMAFAERIRAASRPDGSDARSLFARPQAKTCPRFAPPYEDLRTPYGSKNQEAHVREATGVQASEEGRKPSLLDIKPDDLKRLSRLKVLYPQAVKAGWIGSAQADFQNFVAAAVRANRVQGNSVRVFVGIVRKKLWHHITLEQEQRAREILNAAGDRKRQVGGSEHVTQGRKNGPADTAGMGRALTPLSAAALLSQLANRRPAELSRQP